MKKDVRFDQVEPGQRFSTPHNKRLYTCVKVGDTLVEGNIMNAVVLLDHCENPAHDLGSMVKFEPYIIVQIRLEKKKGTK